MEVSMLVHPKKKIGKINKELYGHFSEHLGRCIYEGMYVGEDSTIPNKAGVRLDIIEALKEIQIPVLRWPGGCFADEYHWKDGIGPKDQRKFMINTNWGHVTEDNSFGTHEFLNLCEELGCEPYIAGNVGSGTVAELAEWVEYMTFDGRSPMADLRRKNGREKPWKVKYLGIGNENWGCGGNMTAEYYANEYKRYQTFCKNFSGNELTKAACGPNADDYHWTEVMMDQVKSYQMKGLSLHYYTVPYSNWEHKGDAVQFTQDCYYDTIKRTWYMEELVNRHSAIMDRFDPNVEIGLFVDEWGCWFDVEEGTNPGFLYQQNTMRDAIVASINLNIFNQHCKRVKMANIAQVVNVLQAVILTEGEKMIKTPTYHVFEMYKKHQDAELIYSDVDDTPCADKEGLNCLSQSVSVREDGSMLMTISNSSLTEDIMIHCNIADGDNVFNQVKARILRGTDGDAHAHNTFDDPTAVRVSDYDQVIWDGTARALKVNVPSCSVISIELSK